MTSLSLFASTMSMVTALAWLVAFRQSAHGSLVALILWVVIAVSLVAPLLLVRSLLRTSPQDNATTRRTAMRVIVVAYVPLQCALVLLLLGR